MSKRKLTSWKSGGKKKSSWGAEKGGKGGGSPALPQAHSHGHVPGLSWGQGLLGAHQLHSGEVVLELGPGIIDVGLVVHLLEVRGEEIGGNTERAEKMAAKGQDRAGRTFPAGGRLQEGVWGLGRGLICASGQGGPLGGRG